MAHKRRVVVIGLGYVGLPLAVALARSFETWGFDIDASRISQLNQGFDRTGELDSEGLGASTLRVTAEPGDCPPADVYIVTVPTPVDPENRPDLSIVMAATRTVAGMLVASHENGQVPIIIYESTVYPGVTEDLCGPELERISGLSCGTDFFLAYSPERINPGDKIHTVDKIAKVVSGQTVEVLNIVADLYAQVTTGEIFRAASIKTAEAAKVIENAQRDINIAFMNEIAQIFDRMDVSVWDVLAAAGTKWNFLKFEPGLVGGHCIGVDPFYLAHRATELGLDPRIILSGRGMNEGMSSWMANTIHEWKGAAACRTLVLGLAFKPNVPDLRNSKVVDLVQALESLGHRVDVHDPLVSIEEADHEYGIKLLNDFSGKAYDLIILAVPHHQFIARFDNFVHLLNANGSIADMKNALADVAIPSRVRRWTM